MSPVIDAIYAFRRSKVLFTAASLGVFDRTPAPAAGFEGEAIDRLLDACVGLGFLTCEGGVYRNTPDADRYLRQASPESLIGYIRYSDQMLYPLWGNLAGAVSEGTHRWQQTFGRSARELFDHFFSTPELMRTFLLGMHGFGLTSSPHVAAAFDLSRFHVMCDLGGATGHLVSAACARYPSLRGIVFDLPHVIEFAREFVDPARVELVAGDFFSDPLPSADLYAVGQILHDWTEAKIEALLAKVRSTGASLLIAEALLDENRSGPLGAQLQSLNMLVCTEGKERTLTEYKHLLNAAGFSRVEGVVTGARLDAILAEP